MKRFTILFTFTVFFSLFFTNNIVKAQALSGTYTIEASVGDYVSFTDARNALYSYGVSGPVTFNIAPGTYNERVNMSNSISGVNSTNTVTFDGGSRSSVTLQYSGNYATVRFYQCDYVTFKNMTIKNTGTSTPTAVHFRYYADYNTISNCNLEVPVSNSSNFKVIMFSNHDYYYYYGYNYQGRYNKIENNTIKGGYFGITFYGSSYTSIYNNNNEITNNEFTNQYYYGIYMYYGISRTLIQNNHFHNFGNTNAFAIYAYRCNNTTIDGNKINPGRYGMYLYYENYYYSSGITYITNNMISDFQYTNYNTGIYTYYTRNLRIMHNTIWVKGTTNTYSSSALLMYYYNYYAEIKNNIFISTGAAYLYAMYYSYNQYPSMDYNDWYNTGTGYKYYIRYTSTLNTSSYTSFKNWTTNIGTHDQNSWNTNPYCASSSDLHVSPPSSGLMLAPSVLPANLNYDFDGDVRGNPTMIGADQVPPYDLDITDITPVVAKLGNNTISATLKNKGLNTITPQTFNVHYKVDTNSWVTQSLVVTSNWNPGEAKTVNFTTQWNVTQEAEYTVCVKIDPQMTNDPDASDELCKNIQVGMEGVYTIDGTGGGDYQTFANALSAAQTRGIAGAVTFSVQPGTYNERVVIQPLFGASMSNTVTFRGTERDNVILTWANPTNSTALRSTVVLNGADYIHFENMTIRSTNANYAVGVFFTKHADYNEISGCKIEITSSNANWYLNCIGASDIESSYSSYGQNGYHNIIDSNEITGGYLGVIWYSASSSPYIDYDNTFSNNTFRNQNYYGIRMYYTAGTKILNNDIRNFVSNYAYGIYLYYCAGDTIDGNIIMPGRYGIYKYRDNYYNPSFSSVISNNMISNFQDPTYQCGIYLNYYNYRQYIVNNTIWVDGTYNYYNYAAIYVYYYPNNSVIENNILISTNNTFLISFYYGYNLTICDYNDYYYTGNATYYFYLQGNRNWTNYKNYSSYIGMHDQNSYHQEDPGVISETNLHLLPGNEGLEGTFFSQLPHDADKDPRCQLKTYLGADEPYHDDIPIDFIADDTMCYMTPVAFINTGMVDDPYTTSWYVNGNYMSSDFNYLHSFDSVKYDTVSLFMRTCLRSDTVTRVIFIDTPLVVPYTEFAASKNVVETNESVYLSDLSKYCATGWNWEIEPDSAIDPNTGILTPAINWLDGTDANSANPVVDFDYMGSYKVCLTPENQHGLGTKKCKDDYIIVKFSDNICGTYNRSEEQYGNLYDDGGASLNHGTYNNCSYLIKPCGSQVTITFKEFNLGNGSYMRLYDGINTRGVPLWNTSVYGTRGISGYMGDPNFDTILTATQSGMVYIEFETGGNTGPGFKLEWTTTPGGSYPKPVASFYVEDTNCVVYPVDYINTSFADPQFTEFGWDYDGNGIIDDYSINGQYLAVFPGIQATFVSNLYVENCGGMDTFSKLVIFINPRNIEDGDFYANSTKPVVNQNIVTFYADGSKLSCVNKWKWTITPNSYYYVNQTDENSGNPQIIFTDTVCYDVSVIIGNTNSPATDTISKTCYITPIIHCTPKVLNTSDDVGISHVKLGDIDVSSGVGENNGYSNFTNVASTELVADQTYSITVDRTTAFNAMSRKVWIDYNRNGDFTGIGELVAYEDSANTETWTSSFTIPFDAEVGATTMRIGAVFGIFPNTPCGPTFIGEIEDYRVVVTSDKEAPVITILGLDTIYHEIGYPYIDSGATAWDNLEGNVTSRIITTINVNVYALGTNDVTYEVCDSFNNCGKAVRIIYIGEDNSPPEITLHGGDPGYVAVNLPYQDPGYTAWDYADGDITNQVVITGYVNTNELGSYYLTYTVTDSKGLSDVISRTIIVADVAAPDITLLGDSVVYHEIMTPYIDSGVVYSDNYWPNDKVTYQTAGLVDITRVGIYTLSYSVTDASGNGPNTVSRKVIVWDSTAPVVTVKISDEIQIEVFHEFIDPGLNIVDNSITGFTITTGGTFYENFPNSIPDSVGLFPIFYYVTDEAGNTSAIVARVVNVVDIREPQITLKGEIFQFIERWSQYVDDGYEITDNYYSPGKIKVGTTTNLILDSNNSVLNEPGLYNITYTAEDPSDNKSVPAVRLIKVTQYETSIEEANNAWIDIHPNPNTGKFVIDVELPQRQEVVINILNLLGEEIAVINNGYMLAKKFDVDLTDEAAGVYIVKIQTEDNTILEKVIVGK